MAKKNNNSIRIFMVVIVILLILKFGNFFATISLSNKEGFAVYSGYNLHPQYEPWLNTRDIKPISSNSIQVGEYQVDFDVEHSRHSGFVCDALPSTAANVVKTLIDEDGCQHWDYDKKVTTNIRCCNLRHDYCYAESCPSSKIYLGSSTDYSCRVRSASDIVSYCSSSPVSRRQDLFKYVHVEDAGGLNTVYDYGRDCWFSATVKKDNKLIYQTKTNSKDNYILGPERVIVEDLVLELSSSSSRHGSFGGCSWIKSFVTYNPKLTKEYDLNYSNGLNINNPQSITLIAQIENQRFNLVPGDNLLDVEDQDMAINLFLPRNSISGVNLAAKCSNYDHGEIPYANCNEDYFFGSLTYKSPLIVTTTTTTSSLVVSTSTTLEGKEEIPPSATEIFIKEKADELTLWQLIIQDFNSFIQKVMIWLN